MNRPTKRLLIVSDNLVWLIMDIGQLHQISPLPNTQPHKVASYVLYIMDRLILSISEVTLNYPSEVAFYIHTHHLVIFPVIFLIHAEELCKPLKRV